MSTPIEDYAAVGDTETAALISRKGSVDWLCLPRFDSASCFTALLGTREHGRWLIGTVDEATTTRSYRDDTFILETEHRTATGLVRVTDVMPLSDGRADLIRVVEGLEGEVEMEHEWIVRTNYGLIRPWVAHSAGHERDEDVITAIAGNDMLVLRGSRLPHADHGHHYDRWTVRAGEHYNFSTTWFASYKPIPPPLDIRARITATHERSQAWAARCTYEGPYREAVVRSLLTLRLLTDTRRGGIVAAATTSLPEDFGGVRNWDYRYCWLRDASLALESLLKSGYVGATKLWRDWLVRAIAGDPADMQIMYAVDGGRELPERELDHLPGYADSRPVRVGNGAVDQRQTDVLGEVMIALEDARAQGLAESPQSWAIQRAMVDELARHWQERDHGLWEMRGPKQHFTHSRVMVWAAFDRAIRGVEIHGYEGDVELWRDLRDRVRADILDRGWNEARQTFTQHYETDEVDASLLQIPMVGFLPPQDPRVLGTIAAIEHDLMRDGFLLRYRTESGVDGLTGDEHPFLACSWWLVSAYALTGQLDKGHGLMRRLVALLNDVGLIAEEYDVAGGRQVGNFPQAFSHLTLIGAAYALRDAEDPTHPSHPVEDH
ncbi:glycoside hydrolase family 15 protein [Janibacter cremeus]|uniref:GH15 family glucan-1,4-alpha-glucosidase n=1 Tax=Janibacter cremeus TaxID=1285192 RepID=A0A852VYA0_9MICO|nr:glycoside hydrolase family 15 protein [Janibacter cremeus]NYF99623.1 GH15 family glucan-1,4-alpha-glucosidase [Janibacter cremeus]